MGTTNTFAKFLLVAAVAMPWSTQSRADPDDCNPDMAMAPRANDTEGSSFFSRLFGSGEKPQPFSGAVMDGPDPGCQLAGDQARPVVSDLRLRQRNRTVN